MPQGALLGRRRCGRYRGASARNPVETEIAKGIGERGRKTGKADHIVEILQLCLRGYRGRDRLACNPAEGV